MIKLKGVSMKKIFACVLATLLLTGCIGGPQVVSCEQVQEENGFRLVMKNETTIKNRRAYSDKVVMTAEAKPGAPATFLEEYGKGIDQAFANLAQATGITYSSKIEGNKHILTVKVMYDQLVESEIAKFNASEKDMLRDRNTKNVSAQATKENLEAQGFTCQIK